MAYEARDLAATIVGQMPAAAGMKAGAIAAAGAPGDFCGIWPKAKPVLELLAGIAILIPGAGAAAGAVLQGLIKVGDQLSGDLCKT